MTSLGWLIQDALNARPGDIEKSIVTCSTCPVSLACVAGEVADAWLYECCHGTSIRVETPDASLVLVVDCAQHNFEPPPRSVYTHRLGKCTMCSSDIVEAELRGFSQDIRWLPTVHAATSWRVRLAQWRHDLPTIRGRVEADARRKDEIEAQMTKKAKTK